MIPVIAIAGYSGSGKTTLLVKIIRELTQRGYKVGTIKHHHQNIETDTPGKDTWLHAEAGAENVLLVSPFRMTKYIRSQEEIQLEDALQELSGVDIILVEGFKSADLPKIEVFRSEVHSKLITPREQLLAAASDTQFPGVLTYGLDDAIGLCNMIEEKLLN